MHVSRQAAWPFALPMGGAGGLPPRILAPPAALSVAYSFTVSGRSLQCSGHAFPAYSISGKLSRVVLLVESFPHFLTTAPYMLLRVVLKIKFLHLSAP